MRAAAAMPRPLRLLLALLAVALLGALPAAASASVVRLTADPFTVEESAGAATITVVRNDADGHGEVRFGVWYDQSATPRSEYEPVSGRGDFEGGQSEA